MDSENIKKLRKKKTLEFVTLVESHTKNADAIDLEEKLNIGGEGGADGRVWRSFKQIKGTGARSMPFRVLREMTKLALERDFISKTDAESLLDKLSLEIEAAKKAEYEDEDYVYGSGVPPREELVDWFVAENEASRLYPDRTYTKAINGGCP